MMPARWTRKRLTEKLGIDYPLIQGPLGGPKRRYAKGKLRLVWGDCFYELGGVARDRLDDRPRLRQLGDKPGPLMSGKGPNDG
jgi:hypothetical protein